MGKLTKKIQDDMQKGQILTKNKLDLPFVLAFKYKLINGYELSELRERDIKAFQGFLDKVSQMTFSQVDANYKRDPYKNDIFQGEQVAHYKVTDTFRIHGIMEGDKFVVIRIDPKHDYD